MSDATDVVLRELRALGMTFPGAHGKSPWPGHDDLAVKDRTFAYLSLEGQPFSISFKLPYTSHEALTLPCAKPKGYGLGKSGWVTFEAGEGQMPPIERLKDWLDESYRVQAPRKLVKELDARTK